MRYEYKSKVVLRAAIAAEDESATSQNTITASKLA